jgi:hypothetical protein
MEQGNAGTRAGERNLLVHHLWEAKGRPKGLISTRICMLLLITGGTPCAVLGVLDVFVLCTALARWAGALDDRRGRVLLLLTFAALERILLPCIT